MVATSGPIRIAIGSLGLLILVPALISIFSALLGNHSQDITVPEATFALLITGGYFAAAMRLGPSPLTDREREVLQATASGATIEQISEHLHLSEGTVRNKISVAISKLDARNGADPPP